MRATAVCWCAMAAGWGGCGAGHGMVNPSFELTIGEAKAALRAMEEDPKPLARPVVVLAGIYDPGFEVSDVAGHLRRVANEDAVVIQVPFLTTSTFESCRARVLDVVRERLGTDADGALPEVDVVGLSMGGLVGRYAASPAEAGGEQLRIRRLFTLATPHRGAEMAGVASGLDGRARDMRAGSPFLVELDGALAASEYEVIPYVRLGDAIVGEANAAPEGETAWWVHTPALQAAHLHGMDDPRLLADIARRLRGEQPYTTAPPAPLPPAWSAEE